MHYHHGHTHTAQPPRFRTPGEPLVAVRQATAADAARVLGLLSQLSERTLQLRYMRMGRFPTELLWREATRITQAHSPDHTVLLAIIPAAEADATVAVAELVRDAKDATVGEIAFVVRDDVQRQGIGSLLLWRLVDIAYRNGITRLSATMLAENSAMLQMIRALGLPYTGTTRYGETQLFIALPQHHTAGALAHTRYKTAV